jgi:polyisoprenoid-binding protein YceI
MNRRWIVPAVAVAVVSAALAAAPFAGARPAWSAPEAATYEGDTVHSHVLFKVKHMGASWSHGRFNDFTVSLQAGDAGLSSVAFDVKAESIDTGNANRDKHLRSPDFLNSKQFPSISFRSTAAKAVDATTTEVTGDLSLHGVTKPVTVKVVKVGSGKGMKGEELVGYEATFTVKRSEHGMTNYLENGAVGDEVTVTVAVEGTRK